MAAVGEEVRTMKRKLSVLFYALFLSVCLTFPVSAAGSLPRLVDGADLLSDSDEELLLDKLDEISERQQVDIVVVTVDSLEGASSMAYADDFFDYNGYGFGSERDGILFLISMGERDWHISTRGYGITAVTDAGRDYMSEVFIDDLRSGDYAAAFTTFAELCDDFITQARTGEPYDVDNLPKGSFEFVGHFVVTFGVGFIIALIATGIMKGKLKTVRGQSSADSYVEKDSLQLTKENDLFLYRNVSRRERPRDTGSGSSGRSGGSSTHISSSGARHGGGGGKF